MFEYYFCNIQPSFDFFLILSAYSLQKSSFWSSFTILNNMVTQPFLITKQMAAYNPFLQADHFGCTHQWPENDRVTFMETPLNETMNAVLIQMVGRAVATAGWKPSLWSLWNTGTLKIKGRECVFGNENGKIAQLTRSSWIRTRNLIMKGCELKSAGFVVKIMFANSFTRKCNKLDPNWYILIKYWLNYQSVPILLRFLSIVH